MTCDRDDQTTLKTLRALVRRKARRLALHDCLRPLSEDDLIQELLLALFPKLTAYDPARGTLERFLAPLVRQAVSNLIRHSGAGKRVPPQDRVSSLSGEISGEDRGRRLGRAPDDAQRDSDLSADLHAVLAELPDEQRDLAERLMHNHKKGVAEELGVSRATLARRVSELRSIFESKGLQIYL